MSKRGGARRFENVLCHADIHAANILVGDDGRLFLVDWDHPRLAPPERDLLFVVGSPIARRVTQREEARFFEGYGPHPVDAEALAFFRCERALEDIGEFAAQVFFAPTLPEAARAEEAWMLRGLFGPGDIIETAEG